MIHGRLDVGGDRRRVDVTAVPGRVRGTVERDGERRGGRDEQDAARGLILRCLAVLHTILLLRFQDAHYEDRKRERGDDRGAKRPPSLVAR